MANKQYWDELYESISNLSDAEFESLLAEVDPLEEDTIIVEEINLDYKFISSDTASYDLFETLKQRINFVEDKSNQPTVKILVEEKYLIDPSRTSHDYQLEAA